MIMHPRRVHFSMAVLWFLYPPLDVNNGLAVQALCPADHVLRDFALFFSEDTLQRRELRAEDEEYNLGPCSVVPVEIMSALVHRCVRDEDAHSPRGRIWCTRARNLTYSPSSASDTEISDLNSGAAVLGEHLIAWAHTQ